MQTKNRLLAIFGLLFISGISAFAEMRADVPFAFTTPRGGHVAAGHLRLSDLSSASKMYALTNTDTRKAVLVNTISGISRGSAGQKGSLLFRCAGSACALAGIFPASHPQGYAVYWTLPSAPAATDIAEVRIPLTAE